MRALPIALLIALLLTGLLPAPGHALRVVAATNDLGAIARAVAPDIELEVVARPDRDPHSLEVRPSTMRMAARADLYLEVGLSLDLWSADIVRGSRNRSLVVVDCAEAIEPLEVPTGRVDASMGDVHPEGNPHYWLDPLNGAAVARLLAERFTAADPSGAEAYRTNAEAFAAEIERRLPGWDAALRGRSIVEYHSTWVYLAQRFGVRIVGQVEPLPGIPPSARHLADLSETLRHADGTVIVYEPYHPPSPVEFLERETGVRAVLLPSACDEPTPESYVATFERAAAALAQESGGAE